MNLCKKILFSAMLLSLGLFFPVLGEASIIKQPTLRSLPILVVQSTGNENQESTLRERLRATSGIQFVQKASDAVVEIRIVQGDKAPSPTVVATPGQGSSFLRWASFQAPLTPEGLNIFVDNLQIVRRLQGIAQHDAYAGGASIQLSLYEQGVRPTESAAGASNHILLEGKVWHLSEVLPMRDYIQLSQQGEKAILVTAKNNTKKELYIYGINITKDGKIIVFLPSSSDVESARSKACLAPLSSKTFDDFGLILEEETEGVYIVQSSTPLDYSHFESAGFNTVFSASGAVVQDDAQGSW
jgi:hypothetical protein